MCGITGKVYFNLGQKVTEQEIHRMNEKIKHRGPDDEGIYINPTGNVGLGHRRLSIIDLSPAGHEPMCNEDGTVWITFNGEIYNFQTLRPDLEKKGHRFKSNTDVETIIHLWEEYGEQCLKFLRGMFAFAIWDEKKQQLFLARDRVGKKPLKYYIGPDFIVFASELKAFLGEPNIPREVDFEAIHHYLTFQYVPHPMTGFKDIKKLPPAHYLTIDLSGAAPKISEPIRYWKLDYSKKLQLTKEEWGNRIIEELETSVKLRMISDVPLGAFLSGGVDSSAIVALMARNSSEPVRTFSIGFNEKSHSELPYAKKVAELYGTKHTEFIVEPKALEILPALVQSYEEPYADSSALPTYYLSQLTKQHVTVALNGDGGDENFAGYPWYTVHRYLNQYHRIPKPLHWLILAGARVGASLSKTTFTNRALRFAQGMQEIPERRYLRYMAYFHPDERDPSYTNEFYMRSRDWDSYSFLTSLFQEAGTSDPLDQALYTDIHSYLPDDLLVKVDISSMAVSLEARSPFLDHVFMEFAAQIPSSLKLHGLEKKYIFKRALECIVPHENLYRKKMGFGVPIEHWFRNELQSYLRDTLLDPSAFVKTIFRQEAIRHLIDEHVHTRINNAPRLWALLTLELWWRNFITK